MKTTTVYIFAVSWALACFASFSIGRLMADTNPDFVEVCTDQERILVETEGGMELRYINGPCLEWTLIDIHSAEVADVTTYNRVN